MPTPPSSYVQAGADLLAAALRDHPGAGERLGRVVRAQDEPARRGPRRRDDDAPADERDAVFERNVDRPAAAGGRRKTQTHEEQAALTHGGSAAEGRRSGTVC